MNITYKFDVVSIRSIKKDKCPKCFKRVTRSRRFEQTINPFNKNKEGSIKTRSEIYAELNEEAKNWMPDFTCKNCAEDRKDING